MFLEIITPEKKVFEGEVNLVTFPGSDGSFQVLNDHAALISSLKEGNVEFRDKKTEHTVGITGGMVEILNNRVIVLAEGLVS
ncbi:MAG: ATP synthase F1 subunit epsilon [Cyclobacteriaceae bacterium]|nr:ATP synthase F1 subunit epsilon [Cyclobacteriaceae bacterium]